MNYVFLSFSMYQLIRDHGEESMKLPDDEQFRRKVAGHKKVVRGRAPGRCHHATASTLCMLAVS